MSRPSLLFWLKLGLSVFLIFLVLHVTASTLGSFRGEGGLAVGFIVLIACLLAQTVLWRQPLRTAAHGIGLGKPRGLSIGVALGTGAILLMTIPAVAWATDARVTMYPGWLALLPGLFAQGGIAEETLFRGYLFGHVRQHYSFWRAAMFSSGPFVAAHLLLFATMSWPVALAATVLAFVSSFPLSHLFESGGRTIWAPALVHFVMQGAVKVVELSDSPTAYPVAWLVACAAVPWLTFAICAPGGVPSVRASVHSS